MELNNKYQENLAPERKSPNLIDEGSKVYSPQKLQALKTATVVNQLILLVTELLLILLIAFNLKLSNDVSNLDFKLLSLKKDLTEVVDVEERAVALQDSVTIFNQIKAANPKISEKLKLIYDYTPGEVVVDSLSLEGNTLGLGLSAGRGTDFAKFVVSYLNTKKVAQINLNGAHFKPTTNSYDFDVEVLIL